MNSLRESKTYIIAIKFQRYIAGAAPTELNMVYAFFYKGAAPNGA